MQWLKRIFAGERQEQTLNSLISMINTQSQTQFAEQKKGLRRLSLAQKQQGEAVEQLQRQVLSLKSSLDQRYGIAFDYAQIIELLDGLYRIRTAGLRSESIVTLADQIIDNLLNRASLEPIAQEGEIYPEAGCEVLDALPHTQQTPGTIHNIIQQGYRTSAGDLVRTAKVVVYREPDVTEEDIPNECS